MPDQFDHPKLDVVAQAIYYANWRRLATGNFPPRWESTSEEIREFVRRQARKAIEALEDQPNGGKSVPWLNQSTESENRTLTGSQD